MLELTHALRYAAHLVDGPNSKESTNNPTILIGRSARGMYGVGRSLGRDPNCRSCGVAMPGGEVGRYDSKQCSDWPSTGHGISN